MDNAAVNQNLSPEEQERIATLNTRLFEVIKTPIGEKTREDLLEEIKILRDAGADLNAIDVDTHHATPLVLAIYFKDDPIFLNRLIELGADVNQKNNFNTTPIKQASAAGNLACVHVLYSSGADIHPVDNMDSAFWHASFQNQNEIMHYLLSKMSPEEHQALINCRYNAAFPKAQDFFNSVRMNKYLEFCSFIKNFNDELEIHRQKLCKMLFADGLGVPHNAVMERPYKPSAVSPTQTATLVPDIIKQILAIRALKCANAFPEWYVLSCLDKDIDFFLNWKPAPKPKGYSESLCDSVMTFSETAQNTFLAVFESVKNYIAPSTTPKRKREDNDENNQNAEPKNNKKRRLN